MRKTVTTILLVSNLLVGTSVAGNFIAPMGNFIAPMSNIGYYKKVKPLKLRNRLFGLYNKNRAFQKSVNVTATAATGTALFMLFKDDITSASKSLVNATTDVVGAGVDIIIVIFLFKLAVKAMSK